MLYPAVRRRLCPKQVPLRFRVTAPAPGVFGLDLSEALYQLAVRELLRDNELRGKV